MNVNIKNKIDNEKNRIIHFSFCCNKDFEIPKYRSFYICLFHILNPPPPELYKFLEFSKKFQGENFLNLPNWKIKKFPEFYNLEN